MSVSVASLYSKFCYDLLEDGGLALGIVTQQEFLDMLGLVLMDFLQRTGMLRKVYTQQIVGTVSVYSILESNPELYQVFVNGVIVDQSELFAPAQIITLRIQETPLLDGTKISYQYRGLRSFQSLALRECQQRGHTESFSQGTTTYL